MKFVTVPRVAAHALTGVVAVFVLLATQMGCGGGTALPPLDLATYRTIAIAPFIAEDAQFGVLTARDLGNQLQIALKRNGDEENAPQVIFDETVERQPITDAMNKLNLKLDEVYADPKLAGKVAEALGADILLVGRVSKPRIDMREDDRPVFDMSNQSGISGTTRYVIVWQKASANIRVKVASRTGEIVWQSGTTPPKEPGSIVAYLKYARAYQTQNPEKTPVPENLIMAHLRDQTWRLVAHALDPAQFPEIKVPQWKEKPSQTFKASGGIVRFE